MTIHAEFIYDGNEVPSFCGKVDEDKLYGQYRANQPVHFYGRQFYVCGIQSYVEPEVKLVVSIRDVK